MVNILSVSIQLYIILDKPRQNNARFFIFSGKQTLLFSGQF